MSQLSEDQLGELLTAYADGEVDAREKAFVEHLLREDRRAVALLAEIRGMSTAVGQLPRQAAPELMTEDIRQYVERDELLGGPMLSHGGPVYRAPSRRWTAVLSAAAMIGMVSAGVLYFQSQQRLMEKHPLPMAGRERTVDRTATKESHHVPIHKTELAKVAEAPPSEETLAKFVDEVLALAGPEEIERIAPSIGEDADAATAPNGVVSLGLQVADAGALKNASGRLDVALRKAVEMPATSQPVGTPASEENEGVDRRQQRDQQIATASRTNEQSWTMRVPMSQVPAVANAVLGAGVARGQITLAAGTTRIAGAPGVKEAVSRVDRVWQQQQVASRAALEQVQARPETVAVAPEPAEKVTARPGGPFGELLKIIGVPESITFVGPPVPEAVESDISVAHSAEERVATGPAMDSEVSSVANQALESKEETTGAGALDKDTVLADAVQGKAGETPGIVERRMKKLREAPPRPTEPVPTLMPRGRSAAGVSPVMPEEKYVTLTITLALDPEAKLNAPRENGTAGGVPADRTPVGR